uniref:Uncharacterized protein n=1 Tax=Panagrolaimus sp. ES5 TaxID=591445 RepID=A0AC34FUF4_9BILA
MNELIFKRTAAVTKLSDFTDSHDLYTTKNSHSWNKSNKLSSLSFLNFNEESEEKHQIKKSKSTNNNSTLSLHIAAYENSVEDPGDSNGGKTEDSKNEKSILIKKLEASKQGFCRSLSFIQNPFEFTRQQEDRRNHPEVMQFKASQQLLNPNEENLCMLCGMRHVSAPPSVL